MGAPQPAKELTVSELNNLAEQYDLNLPEATEYFPQFMQNVEVLPPPVGVNPDYCLEVNSALQLMHMLDDLGPVAYLDYPQIFSPGSPFYYSRKVPWFVFNNGAVRNAGLLAIYWKSNNGDPGGKTAENNARIDIAFG